MIIYLFRYRNHNQVLFSFMTGCSKNDTARVTSRLKLPTLPEHMHSLWDFCRILYWSLFSFLFIVLQTVGYPFVLYHLAIVLAVCLLFIVLNTPLVSLSIKILHVLGSISTNGQLYKSYKRTADYRQSGNSFPKNQYLMYHIFYFVCYWLYVHVVL